jgi:hypothetical protein
MARSFDGGGTQHGSIATAVVTAMPLTMACWVRPDFSVEGTIMSLNKATAGDYFSIQIRTTPAFRAQCLSGAGAEAGTATATGTPVTDTWIPVVAVFTSTTSRDIYYNGGNKGSNATSVTAPSGLTRTTIGANQTTAVIQYMKGRVAHTAIWTAALTIDEITAHARGVSPLRIRRGNLAWYNRFDGVTSPEPNFLGGNSVTLTGSPVYADGPPVGTYSQQYWGNYAESGAGGGGGGTPSSSDPQADAMPTPPGLNLGQGLRRR